MRDLMPMLLVLLIASPAALAGPLRCEITSKQHCTPDGCKEVPAKVWNILDLDQRTFARCDGAGCDTYAANISGSSEYLTVDVPGRGLVAKLARSSGNFLEVATLTDMAYVSFGRCAE